MKNAKKRKREEARGMEVRENKEHREGWERRGWKRKIKTMKK